jgi:hypothetical protein
LEDLSAVIPGTLQNYYIRVRTIFEKQIILDGTRVCHTVLYTPFLSVSTETDSVVAGFPIGRPFSKHFPYQGPQMIA